MLQTARKLMLSIPSKGEKIGAVPNMLKTHMQTVINAPDTVPHKWRSVTEVKPSKILKRPHRLMFKDVGDAAYFYNQDIDWVLRVADALEASKIGINKRAISAALKLFGETKVSVLDRQESKDRFNDYLKIKYLCNGGIEQKKFTIK